MTAGTLIKEITSEHHNVKLEIVISPLELRNFPSCAVKKKVIQTRVLVPVKAPIEPKNTGVQT